jgi:hypothetical protein
MSLEHENLLENGLQLFRASLGLRKPGIYCGDSFWWIVAGLSGLLSEKT